MPKLKTRSGAKKRFIKRPNGKIKCFHAGKRHLLTKKCRKTKRHLRCVHAVHDSDKRSIARMMPNGSV